MDHPTSDAARDQGWISWRWVTGALAGGLVVGGLFLARAAAGETAYLVGLALSCAAAVGIYALIATAFGPTPFDRLARFEPFPANGAARWAAGGIAGGIALWALFAARAAAGFAYDAGLGLFGAAVLYDFVLIKDWFDRQRRPRRTGSP
jgi:hypothetical protein